MSDPKLTDVRVRDLAPGIWEDGNGHVHFSIPEIHAHLGIANTPEEIADSAVHLPRILKEVLAAKGLDAGTTIVRMEKPEHKTPNN